MKLGALTGGADGRDGEATVTGFAIDHRKVAPGTIFAGLAARFFAPFPQTAVAVTGTNGKTSIVEMTRQLWRMAGHHAASIGTLGVTTADDQVSTGLTTPDIVTFLSNVAGLAREGVSHVAFEAPRDCRCRRPPSPISAGTISIITVRWRPISPPSCDCSPKWSIVTALRWSGPMILPRRG